MITRTQWFFYDEWDLLVRHGFKGTSLDLFWPHNEHWVSLPILVYRGLFAIFGLRTYLPYLAVLFLVHILGAHLLWRLMRRLDVDAWIATGLAAVFLFIGAGSENLVWAFQIAFVGAVVLGLVAVLIAETEGVWSRGRMVSVWAVLIAAIMTSGVGVTMVAVTTLTVLLRRGWRLAVATALVPALVYLVWLAVVGRKGLGGIPLTGTGLLNVPQYVWTGLQSTLGGLTELAGAGASLAVGLMLALLLLRHDARRLAPAFAGAAGAVVFFTITGLGRASLGVAEASGGRYIYIASALLLPLVGVIVSRLARRDLLAQLSVLTLLAYSAVAGFTSLWVQARDSHAIRQQSRGQILAAAALLDAGAAHISDQPDPVYAPDLTVGALQELSRSHKLPASSSISDQDRLNALTALQSSVTTTARYALGASRITALAGAVASVGSDGCVHLNSIAGAAFAFQMVVPPESSVGLHSAGDGTLQMYMRRQGDDQLTSAAIVIRAVAGSTQYLNVLLSNAAPYIASPALNLTVCGALLALPAA